MGFNFYRWVIVRIPRSADSIRVKVVRRLDYSCSWVTCPKRSQTPGVQCTGWWRVLWSFRRGPTRPRVLGLKYSFKFFYLDCENK